MLGKKLTTNALHQPLGVLMFAAWIGLITGLIEAFYQLFYRQYLHRSIIGHSRDLLWMAPLAELVLFTTVGGVLALVVWRFGRWISIRVVAFALCFTSFVALLLLFPGLHRWSVLLLATGLGVQSARVIGKHQVGFFRVVRRSLGWLCLLVIGAGLGLQGWQVWKERQALATLPSPPPDTPNVLLITLDTVRAKSLSLHGYSRATSPELERISKSSVRFDRAIVTAPWTLPSHASLLTSRLPHETSIGWFSPLDATHPTLAEVLSKQGFATAGFVANLEYCSSETGLGRGFHHYEDYRVTPSQIAISSTLGTRLVDLIAGKVFGYADHVNRKPAHLLNASFLNWLTRNDQRPFFAFLNYYDAHDPLLPPEPFASKFGQPGRERNPAVWPEREWTAEEIQYERDAYDGSIAYLDQQLGALFAELQRRGKLDNTLVIITSDHGEQFSEHGVMGHGYDIFMTTLHVPLLMRMPSRIPGNTVVNEAVTLRDVPATVLDILGLKNEVGFSGKSLAQFWNGKLTPGPTGPELVASELNFAPNLPAHFPVSKGDMKSIISGQYHYIRNGDGSEHLFNLQADPDETRDLSRAQDQAQVLQRFRTSLTAIFAENDFNAFSHKREAQAKLTPGRVQSKR